jgi:hypothetical protein
MLGLMTRAVQILAVLLLIAVVTAVARGTKALGEYMGSEFVTGALAAGAFALALMFLIRWLEPSPPAICPHCGRATADHESPHRSVNL